MDRFVILLLLVLNISCKGQTRTALPTDSFRIQARDTTSLYGPTTMVRNVKQGSNGSILMAASFGGVLRYDGKSFTNLAGTLGRRRYWDVLEDSQGILWFASTDSGVYRYDGKSFQHFTTREGLASNSVFVIYEDRAGIIWFGTGGGVSRYDGTIMQNLTTMDGLPDNEIHTILEDKSGRVWFGTRGDACYYNGKTFTVFKNRDGRPFSNVWSIIEDKKGNIWFGASIIDKKVGSTVYLTNGLWCYDGESYKEIARTSASAIKEDKKGNIWITGASSPNGVGTWSLSRFDRKALDEPNLTATIIFSSEMMLCNILEAKDGSIWFGSINGVYRYDGKTVTDFKK